MQQYEFEYWSSLDSKYLIIIIDAELKIDAIKEFKKRHSHKKFRLIEPLDD